MRKERILALYNTWKKWEDFRDRSPEEATEKAGEMEVQREDLRFLRQSGAIEELKDLVQELPGNLEDVRLGVAKRRLGKPIDAVLSWGETSNVNFPTVVTWKCIKVSIVANSRDERRLRVNDADVFPIGKLPFQEALFHAVGNPIVRKYDTYSDRWDSKNHRNYVDERKMKGRNRIGLKLA